MDGDSVTFAPDPARPWPERGTYEPGAKDYSPHRDFVIWREEEDQRQVATSRRWFLARQVRSSAGVFDDSASLLRRLGIEVSEDIDIDRLAFYITTPPPGWTRTTHGYWTQIKDAEGVERLRMYFKGGFTSEAYVVEVHTA